jgi:D-alanine-D-alanine ligase
MRIAVLYNHDFDHLPEGVERRSQDAILGVASAVELALRARGAEVAAIALDADPTALLGRLGKERFDLVVNLCESLGGDARGEMLVPGLLDLAGVSYTGSGPLALALALHKSKAKDLLRGCEVVTPASALVVTPAEAEALEFPLPAIVKPAHEDASIGIDRHSVVQDRASLVQVCRRVLDRHRQPALVEQYVDGRELNVALLGNPPEALPISEIDFTRVEPGCPHIVTYAAKWDESSTEYLATPPVRCTLPPELEQRVIRTARAAFVALDCRDYGRVDIRLSREGMPYVIEVNPNCDLSPEAGYARAAAAAGLGYEDLVWRLVEVARERTGEPRSADRTG